MTRHEQNLETARSQVTGTAPTATEKKKRTRSPGVVAGALYQKLCELDAEEEAELAASPESIRAKFAARREKALEGVSQDVLELVGRLTAEQEARDREFRANTPSLPPLPKFTVNDEPGWLAVVQQNSSDAYSYRCVSYAAQWASYVENLGEFTPAAFELCARKADTDGITGFMYGAAVSMLAKFWKHGEALRRWHNKETQIGTEGDRANESGGVLNPAMLTFGAK